MNKRTALARLGMLTATIAASLSIRVPAMASDANTCQHEDISADGYKIDENGTLTFTVACNDCATYYSSEDGEEDGMMYFYVEKVELKKGEYTYNVLSTTCVGQKAEVGPLRKQSSEDDQGEIIPLVLSDGRTFEWKGDTLRNDAITDPDVHYELRTENYSLDENGDLHFTLWCPWCGTIDERTCNYDGFVQEITLKKGEYSVERLDEEEGYLSASGCFYDQNNNPLEITLDNGSKYRCEEKNADEYISFRPIVSTHNWASEYTVDKAATCTEAGSKSIHCSDCSEVKDTQVIPALGHKEAAAVKENEVAATADKAGSYDEVVYCSVCKAELSRKTVAIPALGSKTYSFTYNAKKAQTQALTAAGTNYRSSNSKYVYVKDGNICVAKAAPAGTYTLTAENSQKITVKVAKAKNTLKVSPSKVTLKSSVLKKKAGSVTIKTASAIGKVTYKSSSAKVKVSAKGKVTLKKGTKKGTYKITVKAAGNKNYNSVSKTVKITVK